MNDDFRPMLACDWKEAKLKFPCIIQPKIDGVHLLNRHGKVLGRSLKAIANKHVTKLFSRPEFHGFCGEVFVNENPCSDTLCRDTTSAVNRIEGEPVVTWALFDYITEDTKHLGYVARMKALEAYIDSFQKTEDMALYAALEAMTYVNSTLVEDKATLLQEESTILEEGYEGLIIRDPAGLYKYGRSDAKMQVWRVKRFIEEEIFVTGISEGTKNNNEAKTNELGRTERSSHQENLEPNGEVGTIHGTLLKDIFDPVSAALLFKKGLAINVAPGQMTQEECKYYMLNQDKIVGHVVKFKTFPKGVKDMPRFATYVSHRFDADLVNY